MEDVSKSRPRVTTANLLGDSSTAESVAEGTPSWKSGASASYGLIWSYLLTKRPTPPVAPGQTPTTPLPPPTGLPPRELTERESQLVKHLSRLQFVGFGSRKAGLTLQFLATAPTRWMTDDGANAVGTQVSRALRVLMPRTPHSSPSPSLLRIRI